MVGRGLDFLGIFSLFANLRFVDRSELSHEKTHRDRDESGDKSAYQDVFRGFSVFSNVMKPHDRFRREDKANGIKGIIDNKDNNKISLKHSNQTSTSVLG